MRNNEVDHIKELLLQKEQSFFVSRAGLAKAIVDHFGEEAEEVIKTFLQEGARNWAAQVADADRQANRKQDIQGLINFLWEPLRDEGFEFTYVQDKPDCQMRVTRCPVAEIAKAQKLEKWGYIFHCMSDEFICEGYNPEIAFKRTKTIMEGADYCNHFYYYRKRSQNT
jgi:predicted ArsR family transcriptional regulator